MSDHSVSYADACQPAKWRLLRVNLRPFSIGHMLCLLHVRSPFVCADAKEIKSTHLAEAIWYCSMPYEKALKATNRKLPLRFRFWAWKLAFIFELRPDLFEERVRQFAKYIAESGAPVDIWTSDKATTGTTPPMLGYKRVLMSHYGYSASEVLNMPFRQAIYEACAYSESEGAISFVSADDREYLERAKAAIAKAQAK